MVFFLKSKFVLNIEMDYAILFCEVRKMKKISDVDKNFKIKTTIKKDDVKFYDIKKSPFKIYGVFYEDGKFRRLPSKIAKKTNDGVYSLHANTAGGRVRFVTDSKYVAINAKMPSVGKMPHFALTGSAGFDLYICENGKERYYKSFIPPFKIKNGFESVVEFENSDLKEITINFPLYSEVEDLYIGLSENAILKEHKPYQKEKPVVFYGSSITQGGCASRPGLSYESVISRMFDTDYINLGFSGSARGEDEIAEYIKNLPMSVFVYDYDHNAPDKEHLMKTHKRMFSIIRKANPDLPIVMMSRPKYILTQDEKERFSIIEKTYLEAKENNDKNVYLIDGKTLMEKAGNEGTVDDCHPNDLGFFSMAQAVSKVLEEIF